MAVIDGVYKDVAGRKIKIEVKEDLVYLTILEGRPLSKDIYSLQTINKWLIHGFWHGPIEPEQITEISNKYKI